MKHFLIAIFSVFLISCASDDQQIQDSNNPEGNDKPSNAITAIDFTTIMEENPIENSNIGTISASSEMTLTYTFISQNPENSMSITPSSGLLKVANNVHFDYELNPVITGVVKISNSTNSENINVTINLKDVYECDSNKLNYTEYNTNTNFSNRYGHKIIFLNGKYWSYGGKRNINAGEDTRQIWSSSDGLNWDLETSSANYGRLEYRMPIVYQNKVWLIGKGSGLGTEVWNSNDAVNFSKITVNNNSWLGHSIINHQLIVFNNKIMLIGGKIGGGYSNLVLTTSDGVNWTSISNANKFVNGRQNHVSLIFNNKIWVIGGDNNNESYNDSWSSTDGINWVLEKENDNFGKRSGHKVIFYNNKLWLWGGYYSEGGRSYLAGGGLWSSCNGKRWELVDNVSAPHSPYRTGSSAVIINDDKIISIGGENGTSTESIWILNK